MIAARIAPLLLAALVLAGCDPVQDRAFRTEGPGVELNSPRSEEHTSELQSRTQISYAVFCLKKIFFNDTATTEIYTPSIFPYTTLFRSGRLRPGSGQGVQNGRARG